MLLRLDFLYLKVKNLRNRHNVGLGEMTVQQSCPEMHNLNSVRWRHQRLDGLANYLCLF